MKITDSIFAILVGKKERTDMMKNELTIKEAQQLIQKLIPQMQSVLPNSMNPTRLARTALTELRLVPKLRECSPESLMKCLLISATLGLEPGTTLGHIYFAPFKGEAQLIIGYKGMINLATRSAHITNIEARTICENDDCEVNFGTNPKIYHTICPGKDRGKPIAYYAVAHFMNGQYQFEIMRLAEVDRIRSFSKSANFGPWVSHYDEMAKKTVIRRLFKYLPSSIEMQKAISIDEAQEIDSQKEIIDAEFYDENAPQEEIKSQADLLAEKLV